MGKLATQKSQFSTAQAPAMTTKIAAQIGGYSLVTALIAGNGEWSAGVIAA